MFVAIQAVNRHSEGSSTGIVVTMSVVIGFFITTIMPLGLRTDLDHVDTIKTLPIGASASVWGSIASAIIYATLVQLIGAAAISAVAGRWT